MQNQVFILDYMMTMTLHSKLGMAEEHWPSTCDKLGGGIFSLWRNGSSPSSMGMIVNPRTEVRSTNWSLYPNQRECMPVGTDLSKMAHQVVSPSSGHKIGEGAAIFMDMTETMLDALDQQMVSSVEVQKPESSLTDNTGQTRSQVTSDTKDSYPDLYLPVVENYKIGDKFYGYLGSLSADNTPMVLVELEGLSY